MKKYIKTLIYFALVLAIVAGIKNVARAESEETPYTQLPKKTTISVEEAGFCRIGVATAAESITNVKSKSKNLSAKLKRTVTDKSSGGKWYYVDLFARKPGMYKLSYTYTNPNGTKISKTVKVKATEESPVKFVKLNGKKLIQDKSNFVYTEKAKLSVKMKPGYKLKKIMLYRNVVEQKNSILKYAYKEGIEVKNNSVIDMPSMPQGFYLGDENSYVKGNNIAADSVLRIIYTDKFSKEEKNVEFGIYKPLVK